jgi:hypothetical protein
MLEPRLEGSLIAFFKLGLLGFMLWIPVAVSFIIDY